MHYLFVCQSCHNKHQIKQELSANHSGKNLVCSLCGKQNLIRVYTSLGIKHIGNSYKLGASNPFANIKD